MLGALHPSLGAAALSLLVVVVVVSLGQTAERALVALVVRLAEVQDKATKPAGTPRLVAQTAPGTGQVETPAIAALVTVRLALLER